MRANQGGMPGPDLLVDRVDRIKTIDPRLFPGLQLWACPWDPSMFKRDYAARFPGGENANYLSTPDHEDFDFSNTDGAGHTQVTFEFWKNPLIQLTLTNALARTWLQQNRDAANSGGFAINSGGSGGQGSHVLFTVATNASASANASAQAALTEDWSHCVIVYDGANGTAALRCKIYIDGVLLDPGGYTISGTLPAQFQNPSAVPLAIGREAFGVYHDATDLINRVRAWRRCLSDAEITALYRNGLGRYDAIEPDGTLGTLRDIAGIATGLVLSADLNTQNSDGSWRDTSGRGHHFTATGNVTLQACVMRLTEKSPNAFQFIPMRGGTPNRTVPHFCSAPLWDPNGFGTGKPGFSYNFNHGLYCAVAQAINYGAADILEMVRHRSFPGTEQFTFGTGRESDDTGYLLTGWGGANDQPVLRIRDTTASFDDLVAGPTTLQPNTTYITNWKMLGTGGASSTTCRLNGVPEAVIFGGGTGQNKCFDDIAGRANIMLGGLGRTTISLGQMDALVGEQLVFGRGLSNAENLLIERYLAFWAGVALP